MRVPLSLAQFYTNIHPEQQDVKKLATQIGAQLGEIEEIIDLGARYKGALIVRVVECQKHENSDHLNICKVDDGGKATDVERDENGHVQVVCGAPNVREALLAVWLPPGTIVPESFDNEPLMLQARPLRGVLSYGMMASPRELGLGDSHEGILEIDEDAWPGQTFAEVYHLNDHIIDIENKMFTHRPDCFGVLGVYREIAGIQHQQFQGPEWYNPGGKYSLDQEAEALPLQVTNELPDLVPRFTAIVMSGVTVKPSPIWLQVHLMRAGIRPINNIVDITNYLMFLTGQPLHAYDYDKVKAQDAEAEQATIVVRHPRQGEKIILLSGKEIEPRAEAIMIASRDKLIGVGGVMGGADTEVDENTKNIIIEVATFDMYSIRRTSMAHGLFTDAVSRFNKGQSPLQNTRVLAKAVHEARVLAGGKVASPIIDENHVLPEALQRDSLYAPVNVTRQFINERLGFDLSAEAMAQLLTNVEFRVEIAEDTLTVTAPFWRTDIEIPEDVVEEIGRLYGYDQLPLVLPPRNARPRARNANLDFKQTLRDMLSRSGANEVLSYSFVHGNLLDKVGQDKAKAFQLSNAISPDLQYFRLSLTPSLLDKVHANIRAGYDEFALFEIGKAHQIGAMNGDVPAEFQRLALVYASKKSQTGAAFYQARAYLMQMLHELGLSEQVQFMPLDANDPDQATTYYLPGRAATVMLGDLVLGRIGEYKPAVTKALKLPAYTAGFELGLEPLQKHAGRNTYLALPRFPKLEQDICVKVPSGVTYAQVFGLAHQALFEMQLSTTRWQLQPVDIYQRHDDTDHKQITLRLSIASYEKTLTDEEVSGLLNVIAEKAQTQLGAERV